MWRSAGSCKCLPKTPTIHDIAKCVVSAIKRSVPSDFWKYFSSACFSSGLHADRSAFAAYDVDFVLQSVVLFSASKIWNIFGLLIWIPPQANLSIFCPTYWKLNVFSQITLLLSISICKWSLGMNPVILILDVIGSSYDNYCIMTSQALKVLPADPDLLLWVPWRESGHCPLPFLPLCCCLWSKIWIAQQELWSSPNLWTKSLSMCRIAHLPQGPPAWLGVVHRLPWLLIAPVGHWRLSHCNSEELVVGGVHVGPGNIPRFDGVSLCPGRI